MTQPSPGHNKGPPLDDELPEWQVGDCSLLLEKGA